MWGGAGLWGPEEQRRLWEAAECGVIVRLENISRVEAAERGAVGAETRKGMSMIPQKAPRPILIEPDHNTSHTPPWEKRPNE